MQDRPAELLPPPAAAASGGAGGGGGNGHGCGGAFCAVWLLASTVFKPELTGGFWSEAVKLVTTVTVWVSSVVAEPMVKAVALAGDCAKT